MTVPNSSRAGHTCVKLTCICVNLCYMHLQSSFQVDHYLCGRLSEWLNEKQHSKTPTDSSLYQTPGLKWMLNPFSAMSLLQHMWLRRNRDAVTECVNRSAEELKRLNISLPWREKDGLEDSSLTVVINKAGQTTSNKCCWLTFVTGWEENVYWHSANCNVHISYHSCLWTLAFFLSFK